MNLLPNRLRKGAHTTYELWYHFVWIPKYRRPILTGAIRERLQEMLLEICHRLGWEEDSLGIDSDHVHFFLGAAPRWSPATIANRLRSETGKRLFREFPELRQQFRHGPLWARGYFVSTVSDARLTDKIRAYIGRHGTVTSLEPVRPSDQLSLF